ncbi:hypothetical protein EI94DRAFT_1690349 [Lactarius quietus]|nr:hypothetical protein EI94DRAFT_1690349 [Lactarius quietus]
MPWGNVAFKAKDYTTARSLYSHAMAFNRSNHLYPLNRSMANLKLARWDEAEADTIQTLVLSPRHLKALFRRGVARKELRKWDQARVYVQMFIDNGGDPTHGAQEFRSIADAEISPPPELSSDISGDLESGLAHLHLKDDSSFFTPHNSTATQEGNGAFASRDTQRGDMILSETPIFFIRADVPEPLKHISVENAVRNLSPVHLAKFLSLHNSHTECLCYPNPLLGIFSTNAYHFTRDDSGICLKSSRFNHSCSPNAKFSFNPTTGEIRIYALGTIPRGEEMFISYTGSVVSGRPLYGAPRQLRQAVLRAQYHFTCACTVCSLAEAESKKSDARRVKLHDLHEIFQNFTAQSHLQGAQLLNFIVEGVRLLKEEGHLADADDFTAFAGQICALHSDWVSAKYWAGLTYHTRVAEYGEDTPQTVEVREYYLNPRSSPYAGRGPAMKFTVIRV